jgi:hypothetical protein
MGGLPGVKNKSLIFGALRSITAKRAGVEGAVFGAADAAALAVAAEEPAFVFTAWPPAVDMRVSQCKQ